MGTGIECSTSSLLVANKTCRMTQINGSSQVYSIDVYFQDGIEINEVFVITDILFSSCLTNILIEFQFFAHVCENGVESVLIV